MIFDLFVYFYFSMYLTREKLMKTGLLAGITLVCLLTLGVIFNGIHQFKFSSQLASINQIANLSHLFVRQQANTLALMLAKNSNHEELVERLDSFTQEGFVLDANLYSARGELIAKSQNAKSLKAQWEDKANGLSTQQVVEPILLKQGLIGFLRVTVNAEYGQTTKHKVDQLFHQLYGELFILFLIGALLAESYRHFFRKKSAHLHPAIKLPIQATKTQSQRYHARRRRFQRK